MMAARAHPTYKTISIASLLSTEFLFLLISERFSSCFFFGSISFCSFLLCLLLRICIPEQIIIGFLGSNQVFSHKIFLLSFFSWFSAILFLLECIKYASFLEVEPSVAVIGAGRWWFSCPKTDARRL
ncbi:hypothetical protein D1007_35157 [Hordeum vulgare]|nr:hypothetical protein D1007_35157 [Hordeum vulgare]